MKPEFKDRLREARERLGMSQGELAKKVDPRKKQSFISNFETGARKGTAWIIEIAHALDVDAYWLKTGKGDPSPTNKEALTNNQKTLIAAWELIDPDTIGSWLSLAEKKLEQREAIKRDAA